jgi:hypothetical protein
MRTFSLIWSGIGCFATVAITVLGGVILANGNQTRAVPDWYRGHGGDSFHVYFCPKFYGRYQLDTVVDSWYGHFLNGVEAWAGTGYESGKVLFGGGSVQTIGPFYCEVTLKSPYSFVRGDSHYERNFHYVYIDEFDESFFGEYLNEDCDGIIDISFSNNYRTINITTTEQYIPEPYLAWFSVYIYFDGGAGEITAHISMDE